MARDAKDKQELARLISLAEEDESRIMERLKTSQPSSAEFAELLDHLRWVRDALDELRLLRGDIEAVNLAAAA